MSAPPVAPRYFGPFMPTLRHENDEWSKGGTAVSITFLNGIAWRRHQCWVRISPWAMFFGSFENSVGNAAQRACALNAAKLSFPAMRNKTVRMVSKRAYPRALRFAA